MSPRRRRCSSRGEFVGTYSGKYLNTISSDSSRRDLSRAMTLLEMINGARRLRANSCTSASRFRRSGTRRRTLSARCWAEFTSNATKVSRLVPQSGRRSSQTDCNAPFSFSPALAPIHSNKCLSHHEAMTGGQCVATGSGAGVYGGSGSLSQYQGGGISRVAADGTETVTAVVGKKSGGTKSR